MRDTPEPFVFADDGTFPNSPLPLLLYRDAVPADAAEMEQVFARNGWSNSWRDGIFDYHHFHSNAHEVLGVVQGWAEVVVGGPGGETLRLVPGDVIVVPAGVGHCCTNSDNLLVVGAYAGGVQYDICRGDPAAGEQVRRNIAAVPLPTADPVEGPDGALLRAWSR